MKLRISPGADEEARAAVAWYEKQRPRLGIEFLAEVDAGLHRVLESPEQFPRLHTVPEEENVRWLLLERFPYAIIYEVIAEEIRVLAVAHTRRRPGYWRDRR